MDYPTILFSSYLNKTFKMKNTGYAIKGWLMVGWADSQYKTIYIFNCFGYRVTTLKFVSWHDAVQTADFIDKCYGDHYFHLWLENPEANVIQLTRYTVPDGEILYNLLQLKYENQIIEFETLMGEYEQSRLGV